MSINTNNEGCTLIKDLKPGMKNVSLVFIVLEALNSKVTKDDRHVRNFKVADQSACINATIWDEPGRAIKSGDIIKMTRAYTSIWRGCLTVYSGKMGIIQKLGDFCMLFNEDLDMSDPCNAQGIGPPMPKEPSLYTDRRNRDDNGAGGSKGQGGSKNGDSDKNKGNSDTTDGNKDNGGSNVDDNGKNKGNGGIEDNACKESKISSEDNVADESKKANTADSGDSESNKDIDNGSSNDKCIENANVSKKDDVAGGKESKKDKDSDNEKASGDSCGIAKGNGGGHDKGDGGGGSSTKGNTGSSESSKDNVGGNESNKANVGNRRSRRNTGGTKSNDNKKRTSSDYNKCVGKERTTNEKYANIGHATETDAVESKDDEYITGSATGNLKNNENEGRSNKTRGKSNGRTSSMSKDNRYDKDNPCVRGSSKDIVIKENLRDDYADNKVGTHDEHARKNRKDKQQKDSNNLSVHSKDRAIKENLKQDNDNAKSNDNYADSENTHDNPNGYRGKNKDHHDNRNLKYKFNRIKNNDKRVYNENIKDNRYGKSSKDNLYDEDIGHYRGYNKNRGDNRESRENDKRIEDRNHHRYSRANRHNLYDEDIDHYRGYSKNRGDNRDLRGNFDRVKSNDKRVDRYINHHRYSKASKDNIYDKNIGHYRGYSKNRGDNRESRDDFDRIKSNDKRVEDRNINHPRYSKVSRDNLYDEDIHNYRGCSKNRGDNRDLRNDFDRIERNDKSIGDKNINDNRHCKASNDNLNDKDNGNYRAHSKNRAEKGHITDDDDHVKITDNGSDRTRSIFKNKRYDNDNKGYRYDGSNVKSNFGNRNSDDNHGGTVSNNKENGGCSTKKTYTGRRSIMGEGIAYEKYNEDSRGHSKDRVINKEKTQHSHIGGANERGNSRQCDKQKENIEKHTFNGKEKDCKSNDNRPGTEKSHVNRDSKVRCEDSVGRNENDADINTKCSLSHNKNNECGSSNDIVHNMVTSAESEGNVSASSKSKIKGKNIDNTTNEGKVDYSTDLEIHNHNIMNNGDSVSSENNSVDGGNSPHNTQETVLITDSESDLNKDKDNRNDKKATLNNPWGGEILITAREFARTLVISNDDNSTDPTPECVTTASSSNNSYETMEIDGEFDQCNGVGKKMKRMIRQDEVGTGI